MLVSNVCICKKLLSLQDDYLDGPYEYSPVDDAYGSCKHYYERRLLGKSENSSMDKVLQEYGDSFILVASLAERWRALAPHASLTLMELLTPLHYCMLELIGKGRENVSRDSHIVG